MKIRTLIWFGLLVPLAFAQAEDSAAPKSLIETVAERAREIKSTYPDSLLAEASLELWLSEYSREQLQEMRSALPSPWVGSKLAFAVWDVRLQDHLTAVIRQLTPVAQTGPELDPEAAFLTGFNAGKTDWRSALETAESIDNEAEKDAFLLGLLGIAGRADSFAAGETIRNAIKAALSRDAAHYLDWRDWGQLWPAATIAPHAVTLSERERFSMISRVMGNGHAYFSDFDSAVSYLKHFGYSAPGQFPVAVSSLGPLFAARDPKGFLDWRDKQESHLQTYYAEKYLSQLMRHDPAYIDRIIPQFRDSASYTAIQIARIWAQYDLDAATRFVLQLPESNPFRDENLVVRRYHYTLPELDQLPDLPISAPPPIPQIPGAATIALQFRSGLVAHAYPGASAIINVELIRTVGRMDRAAVMNLFVDFDSNPPINAKETYLRQLLLERRVYDDPMAACKWIVANGTYLQRQLLPLAVSRIPKSPDNLRALIPLIRQIPEEDLFQKTAEFVGAAKTMQEP